MSDKEISMTPSTVQEPPSDFGIRLMDGETVLFSLRPYRFVRYAVISTAVTIFGIMFVPLAIFWAVIAAQRYDYWLTDKYEVVVKAVILVGIVLVAMAFLWAVIAVHRYHYWLTNKRVIWCHGFIGYRVRSVPLERIADVVISRTFLELIAGISSIDIRDMTGQVRSTDLGAKWIGVKDAPEIQKRILEEIKHVNEHTKRL
jgi:uncharacterized membrane protein YdbT with pleckstrin-like domain